VLNLIRYTVSVVFPVLANSKKCFLFDLHERHWNLEKLLTHSYGYITQLRRQYNIDPGHIQSLRFLAAAQTMASLRLDVEAEPYVNNIDGAEFFGHYKMEEVTSD